MVFCDFGMSNRGLECRGVRENWSGGCSEGKGSGIGLWLGCEVGLGDSCGFWSEGIQRGLAHVGGGGHG